MSKPVVLVSVEGGIAYAFTPDDVQVVIVDWDVVDETTSIDEIERMIFAVEGLPDDLPKRVIDKVTILRQLREKLESHKEWL